LPPPKPQAAVAAPVPVPEEKAKAVPPAENAPLAGKDAQKEAAAAAKAPNAARDLPARGVGGLGGEAEQMQRALEKADAAEDKKALFDARRMRKQIAQNFVVVREFAHQVRANRQPTDRVDFAETLYWNAGVKTNAEGVASVSFGLNDSV